MKKIISMLLVMLLVLPLIPVCAAYEPQFEYEAQMLYDFGLFKGTDKGFELDQKCDRLQAAALFIRLLGKETEAMNNPKEHPFTDVPEWASPYVGQMYHDGYTKGISATQYGTGDITANQFATFCLRALNYTEVNFDYNKEKYGIYFKYEEAFEKMLDRDILRKSSYDLISQSDIFLRDYAVKMAYNTLFDKVDYRFLIRVLVENGVIEEEIVKNKDIFVDDGIRYLYSVESFTPYFEKMIKEATDENKIVSVVSKRERNLVELSTTTPESLLRQELLYEVAGGGLIQHRDVMAADLETFWSGGPDSYTKTTIDPTTIDYAMTYRCIRHFTHGDVKLTDTEKKVVEKSKEFLSTITDDMSDYDKYKAAYDYIAKNIKYSSKKSKSGDIDVLVDGYAVCQGYANSYLYLCRLMGLECWFVCGTLGGSLRHAWNKVKLDGKYYNVDPSNNGYEEKIILGGKEYIIENPEVSYQYFLFKDLPDRKLDDFMKIYDFPCTEDYKH